MAISSKDVMALRGATGLGMMECKSALAESGGDIQKAKDLLRTKGLAKMDARAERTAAEGRIDAAVSPDGSKAAIVEINSETDFVAKNDAFVQLVKTVAQAALQQPAGAVAISDGIKRGIDEVRLTTKENVQFARGTVVGGTPDTKVGAYVHFNGKVGALVAVEAAPGVTVSDDLLKELCQHVVAITPTPLGIIESDIPADVLAKEKEIAKAQALEQGKPEAIAEKMVTGKIRKFYEDYLLTQQLFIKPDAEGKQRPVREILPKGVTIKQFVRYQLGGR